MNILTLLILFPVLSALIIGNPWMPNEEKIIRRTARTLASLLFIGSLCFLYAFNMSATGLQFYKEFKWPDGSIWLAPIGASFSLGMDSISLILVILTTFLVLMAIIASKNTITKRHKLYYSLIFLLTTAILGVFLARDLFLFFLFWELELIPMYLLIAIWGSGKKEYSAMKFVLYTLFGSLFMLVSILAIFFYNHSLTGVYTFHYDQLALKYLPLHIQTLTYLGFFIAFAVKLPVVPFHTWLPDAHVDAPTPVSMLLAGILLKMGGYGLIRYCFEMLPLAAKAFAPLLILLAVINILYAACVALVQEDMKKLIAYSSVSHMGIVLLGLGAMNAVGLNGAMLQMIAHGIISAGLFMMVGTVYARTHTRNISELGGLGQNMPAIFYFFMITALASLGLPLLNGFAAETLAFYGAFTSNIIDKFMVFGKVLPFTIQQLTLIAAVGVIITAAYLLWMLQKVFFGPIHEKWSKLSDIRPHEIIVMTSLTLCMIIFGLWPRALTDIFEPEITTMVRQKVTHQTALLQQNDHTVANAKAGVTLK